jgi:hypothetical protein
MNEIFSLTLSQNMDLRMSGESECCTAGEESKRRLENADRQILFW